MKNGINELKFKDAFDYLGEMANVRPDESGLKSVIYISTNQGVTHGPRIKVSKVLGNKYSIDTFTVTIEDEPKVIGDVNSAFSVSDIEDIKKFILLNRETLMQYWTCEISTKQMTNALQMI